MGATLQKENGVGVLRVSGTLKKSEFDAMQAAGLQALAAPPISFPPDQLARAREWLA